MTEGWHPKSASPRLRTSLAVTGLIACLAMAAFTAYTHVWWLAVPMLILAALAVADLVWLRRFRERRRGRPR